MARIDVVDVTQDGDIGHSVAGARAEPGGEQTLEARREALKRDHGKGSPAPGPGVCSKSCVTRISIATQGQIFHAAAMARGIPIISKSTKNSSS